jgi:dienelactone hydrolase
MVIFGVVKITRMKRTFFLAIFVALMNTLYGQHYATAHTTLTFNDPLRRGGFGSGGGPGRQIQAEIYYPSASGGENADPADGPFPFIVFGHGYRITWEAYRNIRDSIVPQGYIMIFPRTGSGMFPDHEDYAADFIICAEQFREAGKSAASMFNGKVADKAAFMGHSLGGGAAFLAGSGYQEVTTLIGLAPAETHPPASAAATSVFQPSLVLSGSDDRVTPPSSHHLPIFDSIGSSAKYFISLTGGGHCFFACPNKLCDLGEKLVSKGIALTRETQQSITLEYLSTWLEGYLKGIPAAKTDFSDLMKSDTRITCRER